jgi:regulator of protease activity HflC (stomatin/prohibitin superfamily)
MFGIRYYKADPSTYVVKSINGETKQKGKGLSFFYNSVKTSISAIPINAQEAPFIFGLQTVDFQEIRVQGQITFRIEDPEKTADMLNFVLKSDGVSYVSDDPMKLSDRVIQSAQAVVQERVQTIPLRAALATNTQIADEIKQHLVEDESLKTMGINILKTTVSAISPTPETKQALEAEAREAILREGDDAIYARRKASVENERTIQEAELQTQHEVQQKEQEIEESRIQNERALLRGKAETEQERIQAEIDSETQRIDLVGLAAVNSKEEADADAYAVASKMKAFTELPVENLKAMALANMQPEQLMAMAFEALAQNAGKIGELNISPDLFGQMMKKARVK